MAPAEGRNVLNKHVPCSVLAFYFLACNVIT